MRSKMQITLSEYAFSLKSIPPELPLSSGQHWFWLYTLQFLHRFFFQTAFCFRISGTRVFVRINIATIRNTLPVSSTFITYTQPKSAGSHEFNWKCGGTKWTGNVFSTRAYECNMYHRMVEYNKQKQTNKNTLPYVVVSVFIKCVLQNIVNLLW